MSHHAGSGLTVVVALATYRRAELLETLLPLVVRQTEALPHTTRVVVVDNDPEQSAKDVVVGFAEHAVEYYSEPRPGIAAARNRALDAAADADALVFLDDDEEPAPGWLAALVGAWQRWQCAAVAGPVVSRFDGPVDPWVHACSTFRRPRRSTGTRLEGAATNNLLLDVATLARLGLRFDDRFGLTGGSDTMLTRTLVRRGGEIRWCDEALMHETVPAARATRTWVLRRTTRTGNVWSRVNIALEGSPAGRARARARLTVRGVYRLAAGVGGTLAGWVLRDVARRSDGELDVAKGIGVLRGAYGHAVTEYHRPTVTTATG